MKLTLERVAAVLREQGLDGHVGVILDALTRKPKQTPGAARQARYREKHASQMASRDAVTESVTVTPKVTPLARVDDNLLTLELSGYKDKGYVNERNGTKQNLLAFGEAWNELASKFSLPQIDEIKTGSTRERHALARLRELGGHDDLLTHIRGSPYLLGEVNGFRCTFDWIINVSNCQKIMEGNYEGRNEKHKDDWRHAHR